MSFHLVSGSFIDVIVQWNVRFHLNNCILARADIVSQIYDHVNVQYTYNKTYYETLPPTFLEQARHYANWVQRSVFTDSTMNAVGQSRFPASGKCVLLTLLQLPFALSSQRLSGPWATWLSLLTKSRCLFRRSITSHSLVCSMSRTPLCMTLTFLVSVSIDGVRIHHHRLIHFTANYASAIALELSQNSQGQHEVSLKFKNGTQDSEFRQLKMFGNTSITLNSFISELFVSSSPQRIQFLAHEFHLVDHNQFH